MMTPDERRAQYRALAAKMREDGCEGHAAVLEQAAERVSDESVKPIVYKAKLK